VNELIVRRKQKEQNRGIPSQRQAHPFPKTVDCEVEVAGSASRTVAPFPLDGRTIDELLERRPERHRLLDRLDADTHLVAVLDSVIHVEAVNG